MELKQAKEVLESIGYPVKGGDWEDIIADLQSTYGTTRVGSSVNSLGDAASLYVKTGNVAFMVDNTNDLQRACRQINTVLNARKAAAPVALKPQVNSYWLVDVARALEHEITLAGRTNRSLGIVDTDYHIRSNPGSRTQVRKPEQILDDLLSTDKKRNAKAVEAMQCILIHKRPEVA
ncbi:hypothetical protein [Marinobacterium rhizophilum]|uniref:Uncharacterized protein n=1 Tax=Marinobacterium rhizophilum TaxID=420402 RepID=A0ABY5HQ82_9GAMM|nr:hypothetical protein [Marinobacterium rhizophilum]UTW13367.1 hypothetical protein KDW95_06865 [Marinobacterium rhizophilum]